MLCLLVWDHRKSKNGDSPGFERLTGKHQRFPRSPFCKQEAPPCHVWQRGRQNWVGVFLCPPRGIFSPRASEGSNADVACDHYHRYKEDLALITAYGFKSYRRRACRGDGGFLGPGPAPWGQSLEVAYLEVSSVKVNQSKQVQTTLNNGTRPTILGQQLIVYG